MTGRNPRDPLESVALAVANLIQALQMMERGKDKANITCGIDEGGGPNGIGFSQITHKKGTPPQ